MTESCNKNSFPADGTSRDTRLPAALKTDFVRIDERSKTDIYQFINRFGETINFTNSDGTLGGNWKDAFTTDSLTEDGNTEPHLALMDAFLDVFLEAQGNLNDFTAKHLEYFYENILGFTTNDAVPDKANLLVELAKHVSKYPLSKGTKLNAGKQDTNPVFFELTDEYSLSHASIASIKNVFVNSADRSKLYISETANSGDGLGGDLTNKDFSWEPFGNNTRLKSKAGFALGSPLLQMAEGNRIVTLKINFSETYKENNVATALPVLSEDFEVLITGEKAWVSKTDFTVISDANSITFTITYLETDPAIVPYLSKTHEGVVFDATTPVLKILVDDKTPNGANAYNLYAVLRNAQIATAELTVQVRGVKNLIVQNQLGKLDVTKPMELFGPLPKLGATFYIGSNEVFKNQLTSLKLNFNYANLPAVGINSYYTNYLTTANKVASAFLTDISILNYRTWTPINPNVSIYNSNAGGFSFSKTLNVPSTFDYNYETNAQDRYAIDSERGYIKCNFSGGDFGFDEFSKSYAAGVIKGLDSDTPQNFLPNPPFSPQIKDLSLDYTSTVVYDFSLIVATPVASGVEESGVVNAKAKDQGLCFTDEGAVATVIGVAMLAEPPLAPTTVAAAGTGSILQFACSEADTTGLTNYHRFLHVGPFGTAGKLTNTKSGAPYITPEFTNEGELYISLSDAEMPQNLSLLFQVSEGSADPNLETAPISWCYLCNNEWIELAKNEILREKTNGILTSGIVTLSLPKEMNADNVWMPSGFVWIRASVKSNTGAISDIIDIQPQAAESQYVIYSAVDKDGETIKVQPTGTAIAAQTISKLSSADSSIKKVQQPYASYGAIPEESGEDFYLRIAERLRHKQRSISAWDYERLVLYKFPSVYKARCIQHTLYTGAVAGYKSLLPGNVAVIVVPDVTISNAANPLKPGVSKNTLLEINTYISSLNSPHAKLNVQNPIYEEIEIEVHVKLRTGFDAGIYLEQLQVDIKSFFAPWAYTESTEIQFGGKIEKSVVIFKLENLAYIDYVTCVKMHLHRPDGLESIVSQDLEFAEANTAASIFTSYASHTIVNIDDILNGKAGALECDCVDCDENVIKDNSVLLNDDCGCS